MKYRVCWSNTTGNSGHGQYMEEELAEAWLAEGRAKYPNLDYWLEAEVSSSPTNPQATKEQEEV